MPGERDSVADPVKTIKSGATPLETQKDIVHYVEINEILVHFLSQ